MSSISDYRSLLGRASRATRVSNLLAARTPASDNAGSPVCELIIPNQVILLVEADCSIDAQAIWFYLDLTDT